MYFVAYHGTNATFSQFDPEFTGKGNDQNGPGFYFTLDPQEARFYGDIIMEVDLNLRKLVPLDGALQWSELETILKAAPDLEETLTDWGETTPKAFKTALESVIKYATGPKDAFEQIWYDFYRRHPAEWLSQMVKLGYDGVQIGNHVIVFNPDSINILEVSKNV